MHRDRSQCFHFTGLGCLLYLRIYRINFLFKSATGLPPVSRTYPMNCGAQGIDMRRTGRASRTGSSGAVQTARSNIHAVLVCGERRASDKEPSSSPALHSLRSIRSRGRRPCKRTANSRSTGIEGALTRPPAAQGHLRVGRTQKAHWQFARARRHTRLRARCSEKNDCRGTSARGPVPSHIAAIPAVPLA